MFDSTGRRHAALTMLGGALTVGVLALDDVAPAYVGLAVVVPVLLGFGTLELYGRYADHYGTTGRAGIALTALGLGFLLLAVLLYAVFPPGLLLVVLVGVPGVTGLVALALGSALLAVALHRLGVVSPLAAALLGAGVPLTPLLGALVAALTGESLLGVVPANVATGFSGAPYGLGWLLVGHRLWTTAGEDEVTVAPARTTPGVSPHRLVAGVVGAAFLLLSAGRFLPLGALSGTPWVNQSLALDVGHLLAGAAGLAVAAWPDARVARGYDRAVGVLALLVVAVALLGVFAEVPGLVGVAVALDLNMPDILLHLPAGVVLVAVGFGVDAEPVASVTGAVDRE